jgi:Phospholipase_D-nuclease N-terminal
MTGIGLLHLIIVVVIALGLLALWVLAVRSILRRESITPVERAIWVAVVIVFPFVGSLVWFAYGRGRRAAVEAS